MNEKEREREEEEEEERKKEVEELFRVMRQKAYEGNLQLILDLIDLFSDKICDREDEILEIILLAFLFKKLREKEKTEKKQSEITAYEFKVLFDGITELMSKIREEKKQKEQQEQQQQIKKPKFPTGLFGMKVRIEGNRFVLEAPEEEGKEKSLQ